MTKPENAIAETAGQAMKAQLRRDLRAAMKRGDKVETALLRALVAALENAEAAPLRAERPSIHRHLFGDGTAEGERRLLDQEEVQALMLDQMNARLEAAAEFVRLGEALHAEIRLIRRYIRG